MYYLKPYRSDKNIIKVALAFFVPPPQTIGDQPYRVKTNAVSSLSLPFICSGFFSLMSQIKKNIQPDWVLNSEPPAYKRSSLTTELPDCILILSPVVIALDCDFSTSAVFLSDRLAKHVFDLWIKLSHKNQNQKKKFKKSNDDFCFLTFFFETNVLHFCCRWRAYASLLFNLVYILLWTLYGVTTEYDERHEYKLPEHWWRIVLLVCSTLSSSLYAVSS